MSCLPRFAARRRAVIAQGFALGLERWILVLTAVALALSGCRPPANRNPSWAAERYRVVVAVVVDQLAAWLAAERFPQLPRDGGFARLAREGLLVRELAFDYAITETAPGHAALFTGRVPRETGIYSNEVVRASERESVSILRDARTRPLAADGTPLDGEGSSMAAFAASVPTVADVLRTTNPSALVYSLSLKDRGAIPGGGRHPDLAIWLDPKAGCMVSSTAFAKVGELPGWVERLGGKAALATAMARGWQLEPEEEAWVARHADTQDEHPGESQTIMGNRFPHEVRSATALRATPLGDELLLALARAAVAEGVREGRPVFLSLSLSANDYIGHLFGPQSWEAWDELYRLDRALARFLDFLDQTAGSEHYAVMLTGDHGIGVLPELDRAARAWCRDEDYWERPCTNQHRLLDNAEPHSKRATVRATLENALLRELGAGPWVAGVAGPFIYLQPNHAASADQRQRALAVANTVLREELGVQSVTDARRLARECAPAAPDQLLCRSLPADLTADFLLTLRPGDFFDAELDAGSGTNHGSSQRFDRSVPLLVRAPGRVPAGTVVVEPVRFDAFARTLGCLLNLPTASLAPWGRDLCHLQ